MRTRNDGFTLVELMVVVLIIGILVAVAVPVFKAAKTEAQKATCQANQRIIYGAIEAKNASGSPFVVLDGSWLANAQIIWFGAGTQTNGGTENRPANGMQLVPEYLKSVPVCPARTPGTNALYPSVGYFLGVDGTYSRVITGIAADGQFGWTGTQDHQLL